MPLNAQSMANMIKNAYDLFKADMLKVDGNSLNNGGNNENGNGSNNGSNNNSGGIGNSNGNAGEGSGELDGNQQGTPEGESGAEGGNGNSVPGASSGYIDPNCPVHGSKKITKTCPHCGHTECGCKFHHPDPLPEEQSGIKGNEITPENFDDLKKQCEEEGKNDNVPGDGNSGNGGGDGNGGAGGNGDNSSGGLDTADIFLLAFSKAIDLELQKATPTMTNVSIITAAGTLFIGKRSNPILYAVEIATKIMLYWSICILPIGIPVQGPITVIVPTNTATLALPMAQEILQLGLSSANGDNYLPLCEIIVAYSQKVIYQVSEINVATGAPVPFMVQLT